MFQQYISAFILALSDATAFAPRTGADIHSVVGVDRVDKYSMNNWRFFGFVGGTVTAEQRARSSYKR